jgi:hypothetical protein
MQSYFKGGSKIKFDFSDIRPKGSRLVTSGGKAPGPQPLKECLLKIQGILDEKDNGDKLEPIEVHDIFVILLMLFLPGGFVGLLLFRFFPQTMKRCLPQRQETGGKQIHSEEEQTIPLSSCDI